jgi:hypothetical protein
MDINERAEKFETRLRKKFFQLKEIKADPKYVAYILVYTEAAKKEDVEFVQKRKQLNPKEVWNDWKKIRKIILSYPEEFQKEWLTDISAESLRRRLDKKRVERQLLRGKHNEKLPQKLPEWYLDRAILDLGAYFEVISSPESKKKVEEKRQYKLIADLFYDFDLFKQSFKEAPDESTEEEQALERVIKRAEAIPSKTWKEHIQGVKESFQKSSFSPSC